jgi:hypothetical protein
MSEAAGWIPSRQDQASDACLIAVGDELLQGAHLLVDPVPSPLQCKVRAILNFSHYENTGNGVHVRIGRVVHRAVLACTLSDRLCTSAVRLRLLLRDADLLIAPPSSSRSCGQRDAGIRNSGKPADVESNGWSGMLATSSGLTEQSATWWLLLLGCWLRSPLPEQTDEVVTTAVAAAAPGALASGCNLR